MGRGRLVLGAEPFVDQSQNKKLTHKQTHELDELVLPRVNMLAAAEGTLTDSGLKHPPCDAEG